jgi:membrane associated rhomboid family serine protease
VSAPSLLSASPETFALRRGRGVFSLHATGVRHPTLFSGERFTAYGEITQLLETRGALRMGTRSTVHRFRRSLFVDPGDPARLQRALLDRIAREPGGAQQLARMAALDRLRQARAPVRATLVLALTCVLVYVLQRRFDPDLWLAGLFSTTLFWAGELWRVLTANLLHAHVPHLMANVLFILAVGAFVEGALGAMRTAFVMGSSALGAMGASLASFDEQVVGASGIVLGLIGAALWLEFRCADRLPVTWRAPRWLLLALLAFAVIETVFRPTEVAAAAHLGGFVGGIAATAAVAPSGLRREGARRWLTLANTALAVGAVLSIAAVAGEVRGDAALLARRGTKLLRLTDVSPLLLNNTAWMIATSRRATPDQAAVAVRLAERAVEATGRQDPNLLDTLAEAQFAAGRPEDAVETIDEAIALRPDEPYFTEQRRRFTGDRSRDDRPAPPPEEGEPSPPEAPPSVEPENPGVSV